MAHDVPHFDRAVGIDHIGLRPWRLSERNLLVDEKETACRG